MYRIAVTLDTTGLYWSTIERKGFFGWKNDLYWYNPLEGASSEEAAVRQAKEYLQTREDSLNYGVKYFYV